MDVAPSPSPSVPQSLSDAVNKETQKQALPASLRAVTGTCRSGNGCQVAEPRRHQPRVMYGDTGRQRGTDGDNCDLAHLRGSGTAQPLRGTAVACLFLVPAIGPRGAGSPGLVRPFVLSVRAPASLSH